MSDYLHRLVTQAAGLTEPGDASPAPRPAMSWEGMAGRADLGAGAPLPRWAAPGEEAWPPGPDPATEGPAWSEPADGPPAEAPPAFPGSGWPQPAGAPPIPEAPRTPPDPALAASRPGDRVPQPRLDAPPSGHFPARTAGPPPPAVAAKPPASPAATPTPPPATPTWLRAQRPDAAAGEQPATTTAVAAERPAAPPGRATRAATAPALHQPPPAQAAVRPGRAPTATDAGEATAPAPVAPAPKPALGSALPPGSAVHQTSTPPVGRGMEASLEPEPGPAPAHDHPGPTPTSPPGPARDHPANALPDLGRATAPSRRAVARADVVAPAAPDPALPTDRPRAGTAPPGSAHGPEQEDPPVPGPAAEPASPSAVPARQLRTGLPPHAARQPRASVPAVQVRIGRVEVQAPQLPPAPPAPPPEPRRSGLAELEATRRHLDRIAW
jgi:hypothetical protein